MNYEEGELMCEVSVSSTLALNPMPQETVWWMPRHEEKLALKNSMSRVDLVFLGDSITQAWEKEGAEVWDEYYAPRHALNLGFNGDRTENILWRLEHGEVDGLQPKLLVLLIGTNNTGHRQDSPEDTVEGIKQILSVLSKKLPETKILLLAIFPRSAKPTQTLRVLNDAINQKIQHFSDNQRVFFLDINHHFLDEKGCLTSNVMNDFLHPNASQYRVWAEAIEPYLSKWL
ncbi:platelet-activating factor acetylhydrolase IB subunit [Marinomonas sp. 2405UD66-6]|uniref:platelet-activating factor acetylhydrolase IB subunit n=1 Tax=Marinomonas sp. 2405UD66-6 TaxID=3391834 RepID=UPI0039C9C5A1